jgi:hypothetical protein
MRLRDQQLAFLAAIADGGPPLGVAGAAARRVGVYADMYRLRLRAALASTYPRLAGLLGDFDELADGYFAAHPSTAPSLRDCGRALPDFLDGWLADLARLEWARHDVFDAVDETILDEAAVRARGADGVAALPVKLVAAHRLVEVAYAVETSWRDGSPPSPGARTLLVWREGVSVVHRPVEASEHAALAAAAAGVSFGALCELVSDPRRAAELLLRWLRDALLVAL